MQQSKYFYLYDVRLSIFIVLIYLKIFFKVFKNITCTIYITHVIIVTDMMIVFKYLVYLLVLLSGEASSSAVKGSKDYHQLTSKNKMEASI